LTLQQKLSEARARLITAGITQTDASTDVELYARVILGWDQARLLAELREPVPNALEPRFSEWIARRERHEPSAYILGVREFWGLEFTVSPAVLIPRPETEFIVEEALAVMRGLQAPRIADIGTGSGCIAVSLAHELGAARLVASDVSGDALAVARANAERHHVADRIGFVETSYLDGVEGTFEVITANPPYVKDGDKPALARAVRHEPDVALFGGGDGLRAVGAVLETATRKLTPGGWLIMEFGYAQDDAVREIVEAIAELRLDHIRDDLQGIPRTAVVQRK
jgi:release factor glutamine methyltransferase